ncbi:SfnB family sulfur acquisition oxidoreductase [Nocardia sp. NPDC050697]|uniref:SfnB family sulfur acquisition oxidoreductase n=1 Tax=Nocardia sp. NPDC050697 TaxID=3155158 RepID=UPI0033DA2967
MTAVAADRIGSAEWAFAVAAELAAEFGPGAAGRDRERTLPHAEIDRLAASGLLAVTVPAELGGADLPPSAVAEVVRVLATADPNIAQIPHSHFVYVNLLKLAGSPQQRIRYLGAVLEGAKLANAQAERSSSTSARICTTLRPAPGGFRVDGTKFYCTGSLFADILAVLTRLDDPAGSTGLPDGEYVALLPANTPGVHILDDWDALGQRTTGSGTVEFDGVAVGVDQVVARADAVNAPTGYGAFAQLLHAAIDAGIARGSLEAAARFVRTASRPWFEAGVAKAADDPLLIQRFGELGVEVVAAESALAAAGAAVDRATGHTPAPGSTDAEASGHASLAVAAAKVLTDRAANEVAAAVFEVGGTRSAGVGTDLDHFWRNARTHTLHDPVRWKYQHIGRALLQGTPPPLHGVI